MKKVWLGIFALAVLLTGAITVGVVAAQDTGEGEDPAPKTILGKVAAILGLEEATVEDAFKQARKDQRTQAYEEKLDRRVENGIITSEEAEEQLLWFQSRPDSLSGSFRRGDHRQPGFGHARSFKGSHFGMRMPRRGGWWPGSNEDYSYWNKDAGHESGQQEVTPNEPSSEPEQTSQ